MFGTKIQNAFNNIKASISPVVEKAKQIGGELVNRGIIGFSPGPQIGIGVGNQNQELSKQVFGGIKTAAEKGTELIKKGVETNKQQNEVLLNKTPALLKPLIKASTAVNNFQGNVLGMAGTAATDTLQQLAYTGENLSTPTGIENTFKAVQNIPNKISKEGFLQSISDTQDPGIALLLAGVNFIPGGGEGKVLVGETAAKYLAKNAVKEADRLAAQEVLKVAAENPGFWKQLFKEGQLAIEPLLNSDLFQVIVSKARSGAGILKQVPGGEEMLNLVIKTHDDAEKLMAAKSKPLVKIFKDLSDEEFATALDVQRGLTKAPNEKISNAAKTIGRMFDEYAGLAEQIGIKVRDANGKLKEFIPRTNYVPQKLNLDLIKSDPSLQEALAKYLYETKQVADNVVNGKKIAGTGLEKAKKFVDLLTQDMPVRTAFAELFPNSNLPRRLGNLEMERILDLPTELNGVRILDSSKQLVTDYITRVSNRLMQAENFGVNNERLNAFEKEAAGNRFAPEAVKLIKREFGMEPKSVAQILEERASGQLRRFQALTKMSTGVISNATQSVNPLTTYGVGPTMEAVFKILKKDPKALDFTYDAGIAMEAALRDMADTELGIARGKGFLPELSKKLTAPGFQSVERFNRLVAGEAGKIYSLKQFEKVMANPYDLEALKSLEKLGIDTNTAIKAGKLSESDLITAARRAVDATQFQVRPLDLPASFTGTWGKLLAQFKNFGYKQAQFVTNEVLNPALHGNVVPLIRYGTGSLVLGEAAADIKAILRGKKRPTNLWQRAWENVLQTGGAGIISDSVMAADQYQGLAKFVLGPTVNDIFDLIYNSTNFAFNSKHNAKPLLKQITQHIPLVGPYASAKLFPAASATPAAVKPKRVTSTPSASNLSGVKRVTTGGLK